MDITTIITQIFLPISLAIIMFGMGLTLVVDDFGRLFTYPKAVIVGLCNQLIFLPLIGFSFRQVYLSLIPQNVTLLILS